jgi:outer membrane immunogenic protein
LAIGNALILRQGPVCGPERASGMKLGVWIGALIAGLGAVAGAAPVAAAPPAPVYNWTGFYIGANAGYGAGEWNGVSAFTCPVPGNCAYGDPANLALFSRTATGSRHADGFTGGVQGGYNWQTGTIVTGVEVDFNALALHATRSRAGGTSGGEGGDNFRLTTGVDTTWLFTARGRLGVMVIPTALLYLTGGLAVTDLTVTNSFADDAILIIGNTANTLGSSSKTLIRAGWTLGGGMEWAYLNHWTFKAEYLYIDFARVVGGGPVANAGFIGDPNFFATTADLEAHIVRIGFNYRFGMPAP